MNQLIWNLNRVIRSRVPATLPSLMKIVSVVAPPRGGKIYGSRAFFIIFVFIFLDTHTAYTRQLISTHNSSKDADWLKEVRFKQVFFDIFTFWGHFPQNISLSVGKSHAKIKCRITSNPFELGQKLPLTTNRKSWSFFQNPSWKIAWNAPLAEKHDDVISGLQLNLIISETMHRR